MAPIDCFHCGLPVLEPGQYELEIDGKTESMCCPGCQAVASTIIAGGLDNYYQYRTALAEQSERTKTDFSIYDQAAFQQSFVSSLSDGQSQAQLLIQGISCAACIWLLEQHLSRIEGVDEACVNLNLHKATITYRAEKITLSKIVEQIYAIGYQATPYQTDQQQYQQTMEHKHAIRRLGVAGFGMMQVGMFAFALHAGAIEGMQHHYQQLLRWVSLLVTTPVVFYAAKPFFTAAWRSIKTRHATMDLPVSIAIGFAYLSSIWATYTGSGEVYFDSVVMFTFFLLTGRYLELRARHRFSRNNQALQNLLPTSCQKVLADNSHTTISLAEVQIGDQLRVKPGDIFPADGTIVEGKTQVDESAFTGEYLPVEKVQGAPIAAGTINVDSPVTIKVSSIGQDSQLNAIVQLLDRAQRHKPKIALLADKISAYFVLGVLGLSSVVALAWWHIEPSKAFWVMLSVLVVSCPCALSLATPTALTVALNSLRDKGFLITQAHVLSSLPSVSRVIFDKTGTLTYGQLRLRDVHPLSDEFDRQSLINLAGTLEADSEHPVAKAFIEQQQQKYPSTDLKAHVGLGISATLKPRDTADFCEGEFFIGSQVFIERFAQVSTPALEQNQNQVVFLARKGKLLAWFELDDEIRPSAKRLVETLKQQGLGIEMLTGDASGAGAACAASLGIEDYQQGLSPEQKLARIEQLQAQGEKVLMIGDGINDVPILAAAEVSVAVANASDLAKANADCVLLASQLQLVAQAISKAQQCQSNIKQNIAWSITYNLSAVPLAAAGFIPPYLAAIGMSASSLIVVLNALRLKS